MQILTHLSSINCFLRWKIVILTASSTFLFAERFQLDQQKKDLNKIQKEYAVKRKVNNNDKDAIVDASNFYWGII